jgi:putative heme-binding domain-containing protein
LGDIAIALGKDPYFRLALLCASPDRTEALFSHLINDKSFRVSADGMAFLGTQAKNLSASGLPRSRSVLVAAINTLDDAEKPLANTLIREVIESPLRTPVEGNAGKILDALILDARKSLADPKANPITQASALKLLSNQEFANAQELFKTSLESSKSPMVHQAALEALAKYEGTDAAQLVINAWPGLGPKAKATALEALLSRNSSTELLLDAITAKKIPKGEVDLGRLKLASGKKDSPLAKKIAQLADASSSSRLEVFNQYKKALETQGDKIRGKEVFKAQCSACHQLEGVGKSVGADLSAARSRGLESILLNIIDPNREVKPAFVTYVVTTTSGKIITGMIASESANSLTLWKADHQNETILRNNIEEMRSTGISFMPEGVEKNISITVMADLLAYLDSIR